MSPVLDWSVSRMVRGMCVLDSVTSTGLVSGWNGEGFVSLGQCHQYWTGQSVEW